MVRFQRIPVLLFALLCSGCVSKRADIRMETRHNFPEQQKFSPYYRLGCGDVLAVQFPARPDLDSLASLDVDGTLPLAPSLKRARVEGLTIEEAKLAIAAANNIDPAALTVNMEEAKASHVVIHGPINGRSRSFAYGGPEPVVQFLTRVNAIQLGTSNLHQVYIVRPNVAVGEKAEVFHVDMEAIVLDGDQTSNTMILASDRIYIGETKRSSFSRLLPAWARPVYRAIAGVLPSGLNHELNADRFDPLSWFDRLKQKS